MGWALCGLPASAPLAHHILHLAAGVLAEITCGIALWGLTSLFRRRPDIQVALLIASSICLIDGTSYVLWNAYHPVPPGDIGRIIWLSCGQQAPQDSLIRWAFLISGALLFAGTVFYFYIAVFARVEALILRGGQFAAGSRLLALLVFIVLPDTVGWSLFDWDQLAPGIGFLPNVIGILGAVAVAAFLFWYRPRLRHSGPVRLVTRRHAVASWTCLIVVILAIALWFNDGVRWSSAQETPTPRIVGPFAISDSGRFLFCGVEKGSAHRSYVIVSLRDGREPEVLSFPGSDRCLGAMWRPGADPDELLFVTAGEGQAIKRLRVSNVGVEEVSSYPVDPNLLVSARPGWWSPSGDVFAVRVTKFEGGVFSGSYVGFSKDNGRTICVSAIPAPSRLLWTADSTLYMTHGMGGGELALSKGELDVDRMVVEMYEIRQGPIALATQALHGSLVYAVQGSLLRDHETFASLPEQIGRPCVDGDYLAVVSVGGKRVFILDATGKIVDTLETPAGSTCIGLSSANRSVYLTASSPEDRMRIDAYDFAAKHENVVFEAR